MCIRPYDGISNILENVQAGGKMFIKILSHCVFIYILIKYSSNKKDYIRKQVFCVAQVKVSIIW